MFALLEFSVDQFTSTGIMMIEYSQKLVIVMWLFLDQSIVIVHMSGMLLRLIGDTLNEYAYDTGRSSPW